MTKLVQLKWLLRDWPKDERVHLLVQCKTETELSGLEEVGFKITSVAGDVAAGSIALEAIERLEGNESVVRVGGIRPLKDEMDVSSVAINLIDPVAEVRKVPSLGKGAIIGVIDSGFELTHPTLRNPEGKTRVLAAWDQLNLDDKKTPPPVRYGYGIEYGHQAIDSAIANQQILTIKNHPEAGAHGTYVAGIAAGNGGRYGIYRGVAPEANLILVAYRNDVPVGGSAFFLDALCYVVRVAEMHAKRVVINISQGDNLGAHDGTSLLERAIDNLVREGRTLIVTSAGNELGTGVGHHSSAKVAHGHETSVPFTLMVTADRQVNNDIMELWYDGSDRFAVAVRTPLGQMTDFVEAGASSVVEFSDGNSAYVYSEINQVLGSANHIGIILKKSSSWEAGQWELILRGDNVHKGDFDVWSDRPNGVTVICFAENRSDASTVTLPGNARLAITVGGFVSRRNKLSEDTEVSGQVFAPSSIGPTRDGRIKPDLIAPASLVIAPRIRTDRSPVSYDPTGGTSMAAPHVTGIIGLLWALWPKLDCERIREALLSTARTDSFTGPTPNHICGAGKVDAELTYLALSNLTKNGENYG